MIQVLERTATLLTLLKNYGPCTLQVLTEKTGLKKTTLSSILQTLVQLEYVVKREVGTYAIGPALLVLADQQPANHLLLDIAEETVSRLTRLAGEHVVMGIIDGTRLHYLGCGWMAERLSIRLDVKTTDTVYDTATGRLLFAFLSQDARERIIAQNNFPDERWPEVTSQETLDEQLTSIRQTGLAWRQTPDQYVISVAAPIRYGDQVVAALGLAIPMVRMQDTYRARMVEVLTREAERATARLNSMQY